MRHAPTFAVLLLLSAGACTSEPSCDGEAASAVVRGDTTSGVVEPPEVDPKGSLAEGHPALGGQWTFVGTPCPLAEIPIDLGDEDVEGRLLLGVCERDRDAYAGETAAKARAAVEEFFRKNGGLMILVVCTVDNVKEYNRTRHDFLEAINQAVVAPKAHAYRCSGLRRYESF